MEKVEGEGEEMANLDKESEESEVENTEQDPLVEREEENNSGERTVNEGTSSMDEDGRKEG